jgi:alpha-galactosidase
VNDCLNQLSCAQVGNGHLTPVEEKSHFAIWSIMGSPLLAGNNLSAATPELIDILTAKGPLSVNQDTLALQGRLC